MRTLELKDVVNLALYTQKAEYYFFGEDGVYKKISEKDAVKILPNVHRIYGTTNLYLPSYTFNKAILHNVLKEFPLGSTFEQFRQKYFKVKLNNKHLKPNGLDRFITKIDRPFFCRKPENCKRNTFDYISVDVFVVSQWESDIRKYISENKEEIFRRALAKIEQPIKKYGIPTNFLCISNATYSQRLNLIRLVFELKGG